MDELKLLLSTRFMRGLITKILAKAILKKTGYEVDIQINKLVAEVHDGKMSVHMDVDAEIKTEDLVDILKSNDLI